MGKTRDAFTNTSAQSKLLDKSVLKHFPKIELHRHLEGTFPVKTLHGLALKNKPSIPRDFETFKSEVQFPKDSEPDFLTFLAKFKNDWYRSHDDVALITYDSVKNFSLDSLVYIELRFSPEHFSEFNNFQREDITRLIIDAGNRAAREKGIKIKYLLTFNRNKQTPQEMIQLYDRLTALDLPDIVGIDLAGDEINYPPELFKDFFDHINGEGRFKSTIHAGEVTSPNQIWVAIKQLGASRIGHGTTSIEDRKLQEYLKDKGIALEQCITSNYQTGSWEDEKNHPIGELYRNGVPVTLNSDDPFIQDTDLTDDYLKAVKYFDFDLDDLVTLNLTAIRSAFISAEDKNDLEREYLKKVTQFKKEHI